VEAINGVLGNTMLLLISISAILAIVMLVLWQTHSIVRLALQVYWRLKASKRLLKIEFSDSRDHGEIPKNRPGSGQNGPPTDAV
jgi:hypothetical protein